MWAYEEDGRGRRTRDLPRSSAGPSRSAAYYYDDAYDRPTYSSSRYQQPDSQPQSSSYDRHRRKSVPAADLGDPKSSRRANVVASDDGSDYYRRTTRDPYAYPERASRHDVEHKTSDKSKKFREKRGTWEEDESQNLRRAKSYSPKRAAREAEAAQNPTAKSAWADDTEAYGRTTDKKSRAAQQYYDADPYAADYGKSRDRHAGAYEYTSAGMPRPPMGAAASAAPAEEKHSKHSRRSGREKQYHTSSPYDDDYATAGYDRSAAGAYAVDEKPSRRSHHSSKAREDVDEKPSRRSHHSSKAREDVDPYATQPRGRHRGAPPAAEAADAYEDPYGRSAPPPRAKHRQSMPPRTRSRYENIDADDGLSGGYEDSPYHNAAPRRRAASVNHGAYYGDADRYASDPGRERRGQYYDDDRYGRSSSGGSPGAAAAGGSSANRKKGKQWQKQAGKLFMTHAVPVIKKEAVPFLTKAAQAYFEQKR